MSDEADSGENTAQNPADATHERETAHQERYEAIQELVVEIVIGSEHMEREIPEESELLHWMNDRIQELALRVHEWANEGVLSGYPAATRPPG